MRIRSQNEIEEQFVLCSNGYFYPDDNHNDDFYPDDSLQPSVGAICIPMPTALAHIASEEGLVVAADGFNFLRTPEGLQRQSDRVQKIFQLSGTGREVACAFYGRVTLWNDADERVFTFITSFQKAAKAVETISVVDADEFAAHICPRVLEDLANIKRSGKLAKYPSLERQPGELGRTLVRVFMDGCFSGQLYRTGVRFYHLDQELGWDLRMHDLDRWRKSLFYGSVRVRDLLFRSEDPRLEKYRTNACRLIATRLFHPDTAVSLQNAIEAAQNFIAACSAEVAKEIDEEDYQRIGGELQLVTITPKGDFEWKFRPEKFDQV